MCVTTIHTHRCSSWRRDPQPCRCLRIRTVLSLGARLCDAGTHRSGMCTECLVCLSVVCALARVGCAYTLLGCAYTLLGCAYTLLGCAYECAHMSVIQCQQQALVSRVHSTTRARITSCVELRVLGLGFRVYILRIVFSIPPLTNLKPRPSKTPNPRP